MGIMVNNWLIIKGIKIRMEYGKSFNLKFLIITFPGITPNPACFLESNPQ